MQGWRRERQGERGNSSTYASGKEKRKETRARKENYAVRNIEKKKKDVWVEARKKRTRERKD